MIIDGLYEGQDFDVAKKIKRVRNALIRSMIQSDCAAAHINNILKRHDSQRTELQKAMDHLADIETHFREICISKKTREA